MERIKIDTEEEYGQMWEMWLIFQKNDNYNKFNSNKKTIGNSET